ncbi:mechanosensitive ion channel family protein [Halomonas sp. A40-4]|uniref:mechanosensitive ion channel family protein n=1 Tax=Halomonas sp. A40-4 TaxID=2785909 RepID=UPI0018F0246C|nr:mechanosensitive ion channel family protein [Halomonas sp. A40-4]QPL44626.1 mechanosensitive ion channel family protein [Halomonas sp. A40-4]
MPEDSFWLELLSNRLVSSVALVAILITLRILAVRVIRGRQEILSDYRRAWLARIRNVAVILTLLGLALIWLPSLHAFALSITAFAVALVIATKELILCLSGTVLRIVNQPFEIGDWVEIGSLRGQVVDETMLATTLQEIGGAVGRFEYSGKTIVVPNSVFLTTPVQNQNFFKKWVYLDVCVVLEADVDMRSELSALEDEVASLHAPHSELAQRYSEVIRKRSGVDIADPQPRVTLTTTDIGKQRIGVTLFCPTPSAFEMERAINDAVLRRYWHLRTTANASAPA